MSVVCNNLLTQLGYVPYCGAEPCSYRWPRTKFNGKQFECKCGWQSQFEPEFIEQYKAAQEKMRKDGHVNLGRLP